MVTAVESNPLIVEAVPSYQDARLATVIESERSYLQRTEWQYDVILLSLGSSFHPVRSGAYSLAEDYRYTVEAFQEMLERLTPTACWRSRAGCRTRPAKTCAFCAGGDCSGTSGGEPRAQIVAFRGYNTATILVKNGAFTPDELAALRQFACQPGVRPELCPRHPPGRDQPL